jgi:hypothetical protein
MAECSCNSCNGYNGKVIARGIHRCFKRTNSKEAKSQEHCLLIRLLEEESNAKFRNYIDNAPDGVFIVDEKEII